MSERDLIDADRTAPNRRARNDRRRTPGESRRGVHVEAWRRWLRTGLRDSAIVFGTLGAIIVALRVTHPIFANQPTVVESLAHHSPVAPIAKAVLDTTPRDTTQRGAIVSRADFERDRKAFAADLVSTGHMDPARADTVAYYAVREAYLRGIPPALIFGVMLTENSRFVSGAQSNVGAVGLMQVYPKIWLRALADKFGTDIASDSTNLKYGIYILSTYIKTDAGKAARTAVNSGLLHYNGCVHGSNTPNCHQYPSKVAGYVNKQGNAMCGDKGFYDCIARPFLSAFMGEKGQ
ncbi:MAG TPA: transglycosylase SLT domain-containing protein [Gemmatimonadaceae bacterium]|jgi:hypothetical protein